MSPLNPLPRFFIPTAFALTMLTASQSLLETGLDIPSFHKVLQDNEDFGDTNVSKHRRPPVGKKWFPRPAAYQSSSFASLGSQTSSVKSEALTQDEKDRRLKHGGEDPQASLFSQVYEWLQCEKAKQKPRRTNPPGQTDGGTSDDDAVPVGTDPDSPLGRLENILLRYAASHQDGAGHGFPVRRSTRRRVKGLRRSSASESDYPDFDSGVPSVDAVLDNSSLVYSGVPTDDENVLGARRAKDCDNWLVFKREVVRLTHTLRIRGWRRLPMEDAGNIDVIRLSGALTNAVYVVTPPKSVPAPRDENTTSLVPRKPLQYVHIFITLHF